MKQLEYYKIIFWWIWWAESNFNPYMFIKSFITKVAFLYGKKSMVNFF